MKYKNRMWFLLICSVKQGVFLLRQSEKTMFLAFLLLPRWKNGEKVMDPLPAVTTDHFGKSQCQITKRTEVWSNSIIIMQESFLKLAQTDFKQLWINYDHFEWKYIKEYIRYFVWRFNETLNGNNKIVRKEI